jgi:hypothetical protein
MALDPSYATKNYTEQGGDRTIMGGDLVLPENAPSKTPTEGAAIRAYESGGTKYAALYFPDGTIYDFTLTLRS